MNRTRQLVVVSSLLAALSITAFASAGAGRWGPSNGPRPGPVVALAVDPTDPLTVYAGTLDPRERRALYRSTDGGRNWIKSFSQGASTVAVDPRRPQTVYASSEFAGIVKSLDAGRTWRSVNAGLGDRSVGPLVLDPLNPATVYAGIVTPNDGLYKSTDGGRKWRFSGLGNNFVEALALDPRNPTTVYAAVWDPSLSGSGENRVVKSSDGGKRWIEQKPGLTSAYIPVLSIDPRNTAILYAGTDRGVYKSTDGGSRWRVTTLSTVGQVNALVVDPQRTRIVYAGTDRRGVYRSTNGGRSWSAFGRGLTTTKIRSLTIEPRGRVLYAGTDVGVFDYRFRG